MDAWFDLDPKTLLGDEADSYQKVTDTMMFGSIRDTVPATQRRGVYPADLYLEGSDQHRGWFQSSENGDCDS